MALQLIFCVETIKSNGSDWIYIQDTIHHFYHLPGSTKLQPVYMNGKGHFKTPKAENEINRLIKHFNAAAGNKTMVIYCLDCDDYANNIKDKTFLENAEQYCQDHGYHLVWFCRDIEEVFLGHTVEKHNKKTEAARFRKNSLVNQLNPNSISSIQYTPHKTNLFQILDQYLERSII